MTTHKISVGRADFDQYMIPNYAPMDLVPVRGNGSRLWDDQNREYIDLTGGIAVNVLGHSPAELIDALQEQAHKIWHVSNIFTNQPALSLAKKLIDHSFAERVFFANSGAEANEAALKLARRYAWKKQQDRYEILTTLNSFHGRTLFTLTATGQSKYREGFEPVPKGIVHVPYNDLAAMRAAVGPKTCAIMVEPIQGEGGVMPAQQAYLEGLRQLCDEQGLLLIFDEVQSGVGRTGHLYAYQHYGVTPDILTSAKSLGGGFPISAMLTTHDIAQALDVGSHGTTYGGNPLACAVANRVLDIVADDAFLQRVQERHQQMVQALHDINSRYSMFSEIRGLGLLLGAVMNNDWQGRAKDVMAAAAQAGVLVLIAGPNVVRFAPALNISQTELMEGMTRLEQALSQLTATAA